MAHQTCATERIEGDVARLTLRHVRHDKREGCIHRCIADEITLSNIVLLDEMTGSIAYLPGSFFS